MIYIFFQLFINYSYRVIQVIQFIDFGTNRKRVLCEFLWVINSSPILHRGSKIRRLKSRKSPIHTPTLTPSLAVTPSEFRDAADFYEKNWSLWVWTIGRRRHRDSSFSCFDTMLQSDGRTDGHVCRNYISACIACNAIISCWQNRRLLFTARCYAERGIAMVSCLSVRLYVGLTLRYRGHMGWNS